MLRKLALFAVAVSLVVVSSANAGVNIAPRGPGGEMKLAVSQDNSFTLDVPMTGSGNLDSAVFTIEFSDPNLKLLDYTWGGGFEGSGFDGSTPGTGALPILIDDLTYDTPGPTEKLDIYFDNFTPSAENIGAGLRLLSLKFEVPADYDFGPDGQTVITVVPDTFASGGVPMSAAVGGEMILTPEPGSICVLAMGGLLAIRRRK
ncbi:MAG: hypothetical protein ACLFVU_06565 [Phycisphaerae bacterium]